MSARRRPGANRSAPSPRGRGPRPGHRRALFSALLSALLLAALTLLAAVPAAAQITIWSATLTADVNTEYATHFSGCDDKHDWRGPYLGACSTALTDTDFVFNGIAYTITGLHLVPGWQVNLDFDKATPTSALTLHLDTAQLSTGDARRTSAFGYTKGSLYGVPNGRWNWARPWWEGDSYWPDRGLSPWTDGQQVSVKLTWAAMPTNLEVTPGVAKLDLSWKAPTGATVTEYDVHYTSSTAVADDAAASGSDASLAWVTVAPTGATASQSIASLDNDTAYRVRVRARTGSGAGVWAFGRGTTADVQQQVQGSPLTQTVRRATNDRLDGGGGRDVLRGGAGHDKLHGQNGNDRLHGGTGNDELHGGAGNDQLYGNEDDDGLWAKKGNDELRGGKGDDELHGGPDNDELHGGKGSDELHGDGGDDTCTGGPGADDFVFDSSDTGDKIITDFGDGDDRIVLTGENWPAIADIIAGEVQEPDGYYVYTLLTGLTVETDVQLEAGDFFVEAG